jgi:hypothetical protein
MDHIVKSWKCPELSALDCPGNTGQTNNTELLRVYKSSTWNKSWKLNISTKENKKKIYGPEIIYFAFRQVWKNVQLSSKHNWRHYQQDGLINVHSSQWDCCCFPHTSICRRFNIAGLNPQSPHQFGWQTSVWVSQTLTPPLLHQSRDNSCYVSRPILAPPPLWPQKHADLRADKFAHSHNLWHQPRLANVTCARSWTL